MGTRLIQASKVRRGHTIYIPIPFVVESAEEDKLGALRFRAGGGTISVCFLPDEWVSIKDN